MLGLYIHIPFCVKKCDYCDFLSFPCGARPQTEKIQTYLQDLCKELSQAPDILGKTEREVDTIFFGGGTPSILTGEDLEPVFERIHQYFQVSSQAEISMEMNPGTITLEKLKGYKKLGINRVSLGVQSFQDEELRALGRIHTKEQALRGIDQIKEVGFSNLNLDLMSGIPGQTVSSFYETLQTATNSGATHISCYSLIIEENTPFYEKYPTGAVDEETDRGMYRQAKEVLEDHGYLRYEISNYAKEGFACQHNLKYWDLSPYLGLGLGASSKLGNKRYQNVSDPEKYHQILSAFHSPMTLTEELSPSDEKTEFMILGLRKIQGISSEEYNERFHSDIENDFPGVVEKNRKLHLLKKESGRIYLTEKGLDVSNRVFLDFF